MAWVAAGPDPRIWATGARAKVVVREFLDELESHYETGDAAVENLIAVGVLMALDRHEEFPAVRALLPPRMAAFYREWLDPGGHLNKPNPPSVVAFMNRITQRFPEAARVIHTRRQEAGDILPYVEIGHLIWWIGAMQAETRQAGATGERARTLVREFLDELENHFEVGDDDLDNLTAVGFLEGLRMTEHEFPALRALLPTRLSAWFARYLEDEV